MVGEDNKQKKGFGFLKLALFLLILIVITLVVLYSFFDIKPTELLSDGLTGLKGIYNRNFLNSSDNIDKLKETVKPILTFDANEGIYCTTASGDLVIASISYVKILDSDGVEKGYVPASLKKPFVQSYANDIIVADLEGKYFALIKNGRISWEKTIDENIVNVSISDAWVILITQSNQSGYKRTIRAYSKEGQEISLRNVSNYYPFKAFNYPEYNSNCFAVSSMEVSGLAANGLLEFLDPAMNQKAGIKGVNEIFGGAYPMQEENLFVFAERSVMAISNTYQTIWNHKYDGYTVSAANVINEKYPVVALQDTNLLGIEKQYETTVRIYNNDGSERKEFLVDGKVTGISVKKKTAAVIAESEVFFINHDGEIMDGYTAKSNIISVHLGKDDVAYVVTADSITRVQIKTTDKFLGIF